MSLRKISVIILYVHWAMGKAYEQSTLQWTSFEGMPCWPSVFVQTRHILFNVLPLIIHIVNISHMFSYLVSNCHTLVSWICKHYPTDFETLKFYLVNYVSGCFANILVRNDRFESTSWSQQFFLSIQVFPVFVSYKYYTLTFDNFFNCSLLLLDVQKIIFLLLFDENTIFARQNKINKRLIRDYWCL